ncbi:uncharacterized protein Dvar_19400 [Desulfosarcina variabilis str. Montpellier]
MNERPPERLLQSNNPNAPVAQWIEQWIPKPYLKQFQRVE